MKPFRRGHRRDQTGLVDQLNHLGREQVALACARGKSVLIDEKLFALRQNPDNAW